MNDKCPNCASEVDMKLRCDYCGNSYPVKWDTLPTVQAHGVVSVQSIAEGIALALMGIKWDECGVLTKAQITRDAEKIHAHILAHATHAQGQAHGVPIVLDAIYDRVTRALADPADGDVMALTDVCNLIEGYRGTAHAQRGPVEGDEKALIRLCEVWKKRAIDAESKLATPADHGAKVREAGTVLHGQIMNLTPLLMHEAYAKVDESMPGLSMSEEFRNLEVVVNHHGQSEAFQNVVGLAYKIGHRDARHAAAELATLATEVRP